MVDTFATKLIHSYLNDSACTHGEASLNFERFRFGGCEIRSNLNESRLRDSFKFERSSSVTNLRKRCPFSNLPYPHSMVAVYPHLDAGGVPSVGQMCANGSTALAYVRM